MTRIKQTKEEIIAGYDNPDPWGMTKNPADLMRQQTILNVLMRYGPFIRAIDLCCGEGFITQHIPAIEIFGWELSDKAASRFPENVQRVLMPEGLYDLILITGAMYAHYDYEEFIRLINRHACKYVVTSNIADWEVKEINQIYGEEIECFTYPYKRSDKENYTQRLRVFKL